jgi:hypothetical protein
LRGARQGQSASTLTTSIPLTNRRSLARETCVSRPPSRAPCRSSVGVRFRLDLLQLLSYLSTSERATVHGHRPEALMMATRRNEQHAAQVPAPPPRQRTFPAALPTALPAPFQHLSSSVQPRDPGRLSRSAVAGKRKCLSNHSSAHESPCLTPIGRYSARPFARTGEQLRS